jgi:hypothetical protein
MGEDEAAGRPPRVRLWVAAFVACFALSVGIPIGYATWYVASYARHACSALEALTVTPVRPPADPAANPSREQYYKLYLGLRLWADEDGC